MFGESKLLQTIQKLRFGRTLTSSEENHGRSYRKRFAEFASYLQLRHTVTLKRRRGESKPWTDDPVLTKYRIHGIFRDEDPATQALRAWTAQLGPDAIDNDPASVLVAYTLGRLCHRSLRLLGAPSEQTCGVLRDGFPGGRQQTLMRVMTADPSSFHCAYSTARLLHNACIRGKGYAKEVDKLFKCLDSVIYHANTIITHAKQTGTWKSVYEHAKNIYGYGPFMLKELMSELNADGRIWGAQGATDEQIFYVCGPGAIKGLHYLHGRAATAPLARSCVTKQLIAVWNDLQMLHPWPQDWRQLRLEEIQFNLCAFHRYLNPSCLEHYGD